MDGVCPEDDFQILKVDVFSLYDSLAYYNE